MKQNSDLQKKLKGYSMLAGSVLATFSAKSQIIYTNIPDDTLTMHHYHGTRTIAIDLNNDGIPDLSLDLHNEGYVYYGKFYNFFVEGAGGLARAQVLTAYSYYEFAVAEMNSGVKISQYVTSRKGWRQHALLRLKTYDLGLGFWCSVNGGFMAIRFPIDGQYHYGWVRLSTNTAGCHNPPNDVIVLDYAYNATPGESILTGQKEEATQKSSANESVRIYPNPANNQITVAGLDNIDQNGILTITDPMGRKIMQNPLANFMNGTNAVINTVGLADGVYFLDVNLDNNTIVRKFVVHH